MLAGTAILAGRQPDGSVDSLSMCCEGALVNGQHSGKTFEHNKMRSNARPKISEDNEPYIVRQEGTRGDTAPATSCVGRPFHSDAWKHIQAS